MKEVVVDTTVLRKADVHLKPLAARGGLLAARLSLLNRINSKEIAVLVSSRLIAEYLGQVPMGRNDVVKAFLELLTRPDGEHCIRNWCSWGGAERENAAHCRFPHEDTHVLRTAVRGKQTVIFTEEARMLNADACVHRRFRVHIQAP